MQIVAINSQINGEIEGSTLRAAGIPVGIVDHIENTSIPTTMVPAEVMDEVLRLAGTLNLEDTTTLPKFMSAVCTGVFAEVSFQRGLYCRHLHNPYTVSTSFKVILTTVVLI
jgi:hypothetical protein